MTAARATTVTSITSVTTVTSITSIASALSALRRMLASEVLSLQSLPATPVLLRALEGARPSEGGYMQNWVARFPRHRFLSTSVGKPAPIEQHVNATASTSSSPAASPASSTSLTLTPAAVEKIKELQRRRGNPNVGLRLLVSGGGCSGFQYEFEICDGVEGNGGKADEGEKGAKDEEETVVEVDGARLFCDGMSLSFVKGSTIDYETDMIQSKFVVSENPNAELGCGCGSSFSVAM
jgi:iron-sulfur cluster assembly accessory protein